ncbi:TPA: ISLre2 family transposase [Streptococcus agalactiae]
MEVKKFSEKDFVNEINKIKQKQFLSQIEQYESYIAPQMRTKGYKRINQSERTVVFSFGEITFSRSRWTNGFETRIPVDEWLGLEKYKRYSIEFLYHVAKLATMMPYRQVCKVIDSTLQTIITKDCVLKAVKFVEKLLKEKERYRFYLEEPPERKKVKKLYVEGDGVMIKSTDSREERRYLDLTHFVIHTGSKKVSTKRYVRDKHEILQLNYDKAKYNLLDYIYNNYEVDDDTILITNSDMGKGYTSRVFKELGKALKVKKHEHFWDIYHVKEKLSSYLRKYPIELTDFALDAVKKYNSDKLELVFDTVESLICDELEDQEFQKFKKKVLNNFKYIKPAHLRNLSNRGIGIMESQHRKITYRMKRRGMYWSKWGISTMANMIILERANGLRELFFGSWRKVYSEYKEGSFSAGRLFKKTDELDKFSKPLLKNGRKWSITGIKTK